MVFNISQLRDYLRCPQLEYNAHELRRVPSTGSPVALDVGSIFHAFMHEKLSLGAEIADVGIQAYIAASEKAKAEWDKHRLWVPINRFEVPSDWTIIGVEQVLTARLGAHDLQGRLDAIIQWNGKFWSGQWKTYTTDLLDLQERVRLSWHEVAYQWLAEQNGYLPWGGTILGACQKLPTFRKGPPRYDITDDDRAAVFTLHYLARSPETQQRMLQDLRHEAIRMAESARWIAPARNYDSCFGGVGRARCPYFDSCHHGESLDGPQFITAEPRY